MSLERYTVAEEIAHTITHGAGAVLSVGALATMTALAAVNGGVWHIVSCAIFGVTLVLMYTASALYHGARDARAKRLLRLLDHIAIFLLIAGSYTPFALVSLRSSCGWPLFAAIWGLAVAGIVFKLRSSSRYRSMTVGCYIAMGWLIVLAAKPLLTHVPPGGIALLFLGGVCYTGGVAFLLWKRLPFNHAIWHCFVLAGSTLHVLSVLLYVIPLS